MTPIFIEVASEPLLHAGSHRRVQEIIAIIHHEAGPSADALGLPEARRVFAKSHAAMIRARATQLLKSAL
jgi:hypothetical protein